jgi:hypothetical protein
MNQLLFALIVSLWLALIAISTLGFRVVGWTNLKQYPLTLMLLVLSLMWVPLGGLFHLARPHARRIFALLRPLESPPILFPRGCSFFPPDNIWNTSVRNVPLDAHSDSYVDAIGRDIPLHADFGSADGYEYSVVGGDEKDADVTFTESPGESDSGPYHIPDNTPVEEGSDHHALAIDPTHCQLYELFEARRVGSSQWEADSGAIFDLGSDRLRPEGWTSADAAGLPILAGLVRYDEVRSASIQHALRFTAQRTRNAFVWPARHRASPLTDPRLPPMGQRFRLRSSFDAAGFSPEAQVILAALKEYGMILADNGGAWFISGARDSRWAPQLIVELRRLHGSDFEAVDTSGLMVTSDSGRALQYHVSLNARSPDSKNIGRE